MTTRLSVNLNKVALLRNQRNYGIPSVTAAASTCIEAGAQGITVHPRPDARHITSRDVVELADLIGQHQGAGADVEYNIEGNPFEGNYMYLVTHARPTQATLVPDSVHQRTSDHGWSLPRDIARLAPVVRTLRDLGIRVSLFMDPDPRQIELASQTGASRVELYTESYATAFRSRKPDTILARFTASANKANEVDLGVNAGHDLNLKNLGPFRQNVPGLLEVSIGHEITADALWMGLGGAVKAYLKALSHPIVAV